MRHRITGPNPNGTNGRAVTAVECLPRPDHQDLPKRGWVRFGRLVKRAFQLRCPQCGSRGIFTNPWTLRKCCHRCGYQFNREDGYFLGAYALNLVVSLVVVLGAVVIILVRSDLSTLWQQVIAVTATVALPILFFPFSRTLWMGLDLMSRGSKEDDPV